MAKEQILLEYQLVQKGGDKVVSTVTDITEAWEKSEKAATAALSEKQIDAATVKLEKFNVEVEKTATQFTSAKSELNALTKQITSGALQGKDLQVAVKRAAELKDRIGDVRDEIGRLSSDTRIFDTFVEGGRAVAAAFSVAQGAAALFGSENKDLQKAILKTQGALALLTGAQELANIVTKQGGIATQAYGVAIKVVEGIQKAFAISAAASWAVATAGLTLLVAGVASLIYYFSQASDASEDLAEKEKKRNEQDEILKIKQENSSKARILQLEREKLAAVDRREEILAEIRFNEELEASLGKKSKALTGLTSVYSETEKGSEGYQKAEQELLNTNLAQVSTLQQLKKLREELSKFETPQVKATDELPKQLDSPLLPLVNEESVNMNKINVERMNEDLRQFGFDRAIQEQEKFNQKRRELTDAYLQFASNAANSLSSIISSGFQQESMNLQQEKDKQLATVGDNTKKREAIEKQFAVKSAQLKRKQAIADKVFSIFQIGIATAQAIQKQLAATPLPAGAAFIALIAASAAAQVAAVAAQPLPEIPKFAKGVIGFKGKGTQTSDENLVMISNNESILKGKATEKYGEELNAANNLELEDLIYHKYLLPALKQAGAADKDGNLYDDWMLRREVRESRQADKDNSKYIASSIVSAIKENNYNARKHYINN